MLTLLWQECPFLFPYILETGTLDIVNECKLPESSVIGSDQAFLSMLFFKLSNRAYRATWLFAANFMQDSDKNPCVLRSYKIAVYHRTAEQRTNRTTLSIFKTTYFFKIVLFSTSLKVEQKR